MGVQKIGQGRYRIFVDLGRDADGRRRRHTEIVRGTKKEAEHREREVLRGRDSGTYVEPQRLTVGEYMTRWLRAVEHQVEPNTFRGYEQRSRTHIIRDLGHIRLQELRPLQIQEAEDSWLERGNRRSGGPLDPQTVLHIHRCMHTALEQAVKWRLLQANPANGVQEPHVSQKEQAFLTQEESERVIGALAGSPYRMPILVGLYCGLRPTEYLALRWRDVDLDGRALRVMQNVHRIRQDEVTRHMGLEVHGFRFGPAKTHRSRRPVSMPRDVADLLRAWKPAQAEERLRAGSAWTDLDLVFTDARGHPLNPDRVRRDFYRALKAADVRRVVLYALRHTSATLTLAATKDIKLVAARLGHTSEVLVLRTYGHLLPGADREAADRLGEAVRLHSDHAGHTNGTSDTATGTDGGEQ